MKFTFSLESVLKVREHREQAQKQAYALETRNMQEIKSQLIDARDKLDQMNSEEGLNSISNIQHMRRQFSHMQQMHAMIGKLNQDLTRADKRVSTERERLVEAHRLTHIMESAKEREFARYRHEFNQAEQKQMDDISSIIAVRKGL